MLITFLFPFINITSDQFQFHIQILNPTGQLSDISEEVSDKQLRLVHNFASREESGMIEGKTVSGLCLNCLCSHLWLQLKVILSHSTCRLFSISRSLATNREWVMHSLPFQLFPLTPSVNVTHIQFVAAVHPDCHTFQYKYTKIQVISKHPVLPHRFYSLYTKLNYEQWNCCCCSI